MVLYKIIDGRLVSIVDQDTLIREAKYCFLNSDFEEELDLDDVEIAIEFLNRAYKVEKVVN